MPPLIPFLLLFAQSIPINVPTGWQLKNAEASVTTYKGRESIKVIGKVATDDATLVLKNTAFHDGTIDLDVAGAPGQVPIEGARGFIGLNFRVQPDPAKHERFYIRPTNGRADDQLRRNHSVQYTSEPAWPWERLRKESPGVYESYADIQPAEWIHLRIVVHGTQAALYVANSSQPALLVHDLKLGDSEGALALWIGPGTDGYFANLRVDSTTPANPQYGSDDTAGHYVQTQDAKLYYEQYGVGGRPLVLLHGGEYGYIDEFGDLIREFSKQRTVIAIATRGYGRSERGKLPLSHRQFAVDAAAIIEKAVPHGEKVDLLGFSEGAITAYILAASRPELLHRLVAIGGSLGMYGQTKQSLAAPPLTPERMQKEVPGLVALRKKVMAHPEQWDALITELDRMYHQPVFVKPQEIRSIAIPTLVMAGDQDYYNRTEHTLEIFRMLPQAQLAIIPGCGHVVLDCKADLVISTVATFLEQQP